MKKTIMIKVFSLLITSLITLPVNSLGHTYNKDVKVKVFRLNDKKEVPHKELKSERGLFFCCEGGDGDDLGRIEISSKSESSIKVEIEDNETRKTLLSGIYYLGNYGKSKMTFNVFPWIQTCDYGYLGVTVRVFSNDISILEFKYYSSVCD